MNRTKIEYVDYSWNPVTGCLGPGARPDAPNRCSYCYAQRLANGRLRERYRKNRKGCLDPIGYDWVDYEWDAFWPRLWPARLNEPKARKMPARIFTVDMGDLFHPHIPMIWQKMVYEVIRRCPQHTFLLLTKNPAGYLPFQPWPKNCWLGITVTNQADWDERWPEMENVEAKTRWVSFEPLLGQVQLWGDPWELENELFPDWLVIGALTGKGGTQPERRWVATIEGDAACIPSSPPIFHKDNLDCEGMGIERRREMPG